MATMSAQMPSASLMSKRTLSKTACKKVGEVGVGWGLQGGVVLEA
jgi:hypothetical protein